MVGTSSCPLTKRREGSLSSVAAWVSRSLSRSSLYLPFLLKSSKTLPLPGCFARVAFGLAFLVLATADFSLTDSAVPLFAPLLCSVNVFAIFFLPPVFFTGELLSVVLDTASCARDSIATSDLV